MKPGILSSTLHFPEMMLNLITSSVSDSLVRRTADAPIQGGELQDQEGEEGAPQECGGR